MHWKQRGNIEMIQHIVKSKKTKKTKRPRDEEYTKKMKGRKQPLSKKMDRMEK